MNRWYVIGPALLIAGVLLVHPHQRQPQPVLTVKDVPRPARPTKLPTQTVTVYVVGAVTKSGVYRLPTGTRIEDAVRMAGGLNGSANPAGVNLAELLTDGQEVDVPSRNLPADHLRLRESTRGVTSRKGRSMHRTSRHRKATPGRAIDINSADAAALEALPGIGTGLAQRLVDFREVNGPFHSLDELADVAGMTDRRIDQIAPYITLR